MARAVSLNPIIDRTEGESLVFRAQVQFWGNDLEAPDSSVVEFVVGPTDSVATIRDSFVAAIRAEATRLDYTLPNNSILIPAYIKA